MGSEVSGVELDAVGGRVQDEFNIIRLGGCVKGKVNVAQASCLDLLIRKSHVLEISKHIRGYNSIEGVNSSS